MHAAPSTTTPWDTNRSIQFIGILFLVDVLEIGPGNEISLQHLLDQHLREQFAPARVYGVEISGRFWDLLPDRFDEEIQQDNLSFHNDGARDLTFLQDNPVDVGVFGLNVKFTGEVFAEERYHAFQPGAKVFFWINAEAQAFRNNTCFFNVDWAKCLSGTIRVS